MRAPRTGSVDRISAPTISVRLVDRAVIEALASGEIVARLGRYTFSVGAFGTRVADRLSELRTGLPLELVALNKEIELLVRRLSGHGLVEYRLARPQGAEDVVVIEPQIIDYWPRMPQLGNADRFVLSRFAYMRRRGHFMVLESPRAGALFKICDPKIATLVATLSNPQSVKELRLQDGFPGIAFFALLVDCRIIVNTDAAAESETREDADTLTVWEFHDLLFHARSTQGRHANAVGALYPHAGLIAPLPAVRPAWPGKQIALETFISGEAAPAEGPARATKSLWNHHSVRSFDNRRPVTLTELSQFLDLAARVLSRSGETGKDDYEATTVRPYPCAGASYELELYLAVNTCDGLARGFYHYDAGAHALTPIGVPADAFDALLVGAAQAIGVHAAPQILITIAARFGRVAWKYSSIAYALILKDAGVLTQKLYLTAAELKLGGCAIGIANIDLFAKMTGLEFYVEGPVGQFALGRAAKPDVLD